MAITHVNTTTASAQGPHETVDSLSIDYPAGLQPGDVLHLAVGLPKSQWYERVGNQFLLAREYRLGIPPGWTVVRSGGPTNYLLSDQWRIPRVLVLRKVATGAESGGVTVPITRSAPRPEAVVPGENVAVAGVMTAHRGVAHHLIEGPWDSGLDTGIRVRQRPRATYPDSVALQFAFAGHGGVTEGDPAPAIPDPLVVASPPPAEWDVLGQASSLGLPVGASVVANRVGALAAPAPVNELLTYGGSSSAYHARVAVVLVDEAQGPSVDAPPEPGQPGVTGSGWLVPEWEGRERQVVTPLATTILGEGGGDLTPVLEPEATPQAVALDATFNGLGACTSATAAFPAFPGLVPYQHALAFGLRLTADPEAVVTWWVGVVRNVRYDNGLHVVDLDGFWNLLNDARVRTEVDVNDVESITTPEHPIILGVLRVGVGDPATALVEEPREAMVSWGEHLNDRFRHTPDAAWGIGPDRVFIMGLPEQGGVLDLDADTHHAITRVTAGEYILPPTITEWWGELEDGAIVTASVSPAGMLAPERVVSARTNENDDLVTPKEAAHPLVAGPTHELEVAGIAVPPLRVVNLPGGVSQMVASARVRVNVGEEGSMPRITTTLTTVALPY